MKKNIIFSFFAGLGLFLFLPFCVFAQESIKLSAPDLSTGTSLMQALSRRQSLRSFSDQELSVDVLSRLLWAANGVNRVDSGKRTAPSARNAQAIDIYVAMKSGLYRYDALGHVLSPISSNDIRQVVGVQDFTQDAPVNLIFVANLSKFSGDPDVKNFYAATDTAFISQNVYLFCASEGLSTVVLGWFDQQALSQAMDLASDQKVILTQPLGYPK